MHDDGQEELVNGQMEQTDRVDRVEQAGRGEKADRAAQAADRKDPADRTAAAQAGGSAAAQAGRPGAAGTGGAWRAAAPEYQGALGALSVNTSVSDVLARGVEELRAAETAGDLREAARCGLAVAEAYRRLGRTAEADAAWKASYRTARSAGDAAGMAWGLWSGGTLARQTGRLRLAYRLLRLASEWGGLSGDVVARGYSLAGLAETGRIQGDYAAVARLHEQLLAEARRRGEARHTVWALEGIAQMHRNNGSYDQALALFEEAADTALRADDRRGWAWAVRGVADVLSARDGRAEEALSLLSQAEEACRVMDLRSALAFNHKMRGNVLYRTGRYAEARDTYAYALTEFEDIAEPRGTALARLGLTKALARLGRDLAETAADLVEVRGRLQAIGLQHARDMVDKAAAELGVGPLPGPADRAHPADPADPAGGEGVTDGNRTRTAAGRAVTAAATPGTAASTVAASTVAAPAVAVGRTVPGAAGAAVGAATAATADTAAGLAGAAGASGPSGTGRAAGTGRQGAA